MAPTNDFPSFLSTLSGQARSRWSKRTKRAVGAALRAPSLTFEPLEPRLLLSADLNPLATTTALTSQTPFTSTPTVSIPTTQSNNTSLVLSDAAASAASAVSGSIDVPGQTNRYSFTLTQATNLVFDSLTNQSTLTWSLDGPRGNEVSNRSFTNSDSYNINSPVLSLLPGDYTVSVNGQGSATGAYSFQFLDLSKAKPITSGLVVSDSNTPGNTTNAYSFTATAGERVFIDTQSSTGSMTMRLLDPFQQQVFNTGFSDQNVTVTAAGTYTLLVEGYIGNTAPTSYKFVVDAQADTTSALTLGAVTTGSVAQPGQLDTYSFTLASESKLLFDSLTNDGSITWSLTGPAGTAVSGRGFSSSDGANIGGTPLMDLPAGSYKLTVQGSADHTGPFAFRLLDTATASPIARDVAVSGTLDDGQQGRGTKLFSYTATRGDQLQLSVTSAAATYNAYYRIYDPSGRMISADYLRNGVTMTQLLTGTYTIAVEGAVGNTAAVPYSFTLASQGTTTVPAFTGTAVALGAAVSKAVAANETDDYVFTVPAGKKLDVDVSGATNYVSWTLDGPRGNEATGDFYTDQVVALSVAGTYRFRIAGSANASGNTVGFRLLDFAAATPVTAGTAVTLSQPAQGAAVYSLTATAGDKYYFDVTNGSNANWQLLDPYGNSIFNQGFSPTGPVVLGTTGTYSLIVSGYYYTGAPSGSFAINKVVDTTQALTLGATVNGSITTPGQTATYTFTLTSPTVVAFDSLDYDSPSWTLTDPSGTVGTGSFYNNLTYFSLAAGSYSFAVTRGGDATGAFAFRLVDTGVAQAITYGTTVTATSTPPQAVKAWSFTAQAGDRVYLDTLANTDSSLQWSLLDPFGRTVFNQTSFSPQGILTLAYGGTYTIITRAVAYDTSASATYSFKLWKEADPTDAITIGGTAQTGPLSSAGQVGSALRFTGAEYATVPNGANTDLRSTVTVEFWVKPDQFPNQWTSLIYKGLPDQNYPNGPRTYSVWLNNSGYVLLSTQDATGEQTVQTAAGTIALGAWTHVAAVIDRVNGTMSIYLNGVLSVTGSVRTGAALGSASPLSIARGVTDSGGGPLYGTLDDVRIYSVARTAAAIASDYNKALTGTEAGLVLYLPMNDASGSATLADKSTSGTNATLVTPNAGVPGVITGQITIPGQVHTYTFTLASATRLLFDGLIDNGNVTVTLTGPNGFSVTRNLRADSYEFGSANPIIFAPAGTYSITVTDSGDRTDPYAFRFIDLASAQAIAVNTTVSGTLPSGGQTRLFSFTATAGTRIYLNQLGFSTYTSYASFRLIDPNGNQLFGPVNVDDVGSTLLSVSGTYTLLLEGRVFDTAAQTYSFAVDTITDQTTAITLGTNPSPGPYWVPGQLGGALQLTGADGISVADNSAVDLTNTVTVEAWIRVDRFANTWMPVVVKSGPNDSDYSQRTYGLWINANGSVLFSTYGGNAQSAAGTIVLGQWVHIAGVMDRTNGVITVYINGVQVGTAGVSTALAPVSASPLLIGQTTEFDGSYSDFVGAIDDVRVWSTARTAAQILAGKNAALTGPQAGLALYLKFDDGSGNSAADASGNGHAGTLLRQNADGITGQITSPGQQLHYTFTLATATTLIADAFTNVSNLTWTLTGPNGDVVSSLAFTSTDANRGNPLLNLVAGAYTLTIAGVGDATGLFNFRFLTPAEATPIVKGTATDITLLPGQRAQSYTFSATAGDRVFFDATGGSANLYIRVYDPNGNDLFGAQYWSSLTSSDIHILQTTGTYTVVVDNDVYYGNGGAVTLTGQSVVDKTATLALGTTVTGSIDTAGQSTIYSLSLAGPTKVYFDSLTNNGNLVWSLTGPNGAVITNRSFNGSDSYDVSNPEIDLAAGTYTLTVRGTTDTTGAFSFRLLDFASATALAAATPVTGTLPAQQTRLYTFTATAQDRVQFTVQSVSGDVAWRLLDAYGNQVFGPTSLNSTGLITLPSTGTYTLATEGRVYSPSTPISYGFTYLRVAVAANAGATGQTFDATGLPYVLSQYGSGAAASVVAGGTTGSFLRLTQASATYQNNVIDFNATGAGPFDSIQADFDFRIAPGSTRGLGIGAVLLDAAKWGTGGPSTSYGFVPSLQGGLGVKLSVSNDGNDNQVALTWNGTTITTVAAGFDLGAGAWDHARLVVTRTDGGALVSVILTPNGGAATTVVNKVFVGGYFPSTSRLAIVGETDYRTATQDVDNIAIATTAQSVATPGLTFGTTVSGSIATAGAVEQYQFDLAAAKSVLFDSLTSQYQFSWTLTGPGGVVVNSRGFGSSDSYDLGGTSPLLALPTGHYVLSVFSTYTGFTGSYSFRLLDLASATALTLGTATTATLNPANATIAYSFTAASGDKLYIDTTTGADGSYRVIDAAGNQIVSQTSLNGDVGPFTIPHAGQYFLLVEGRYFDTSTASVAFTLAKTNDTTQALTVGANVAGSIASAGQTNAYTVTFSKPTLLYFDSQTNDGSLYWSLVDSRGTTISGQPFNYNDSAVLSVAAGTYTLSVTQNGATGHTGSYGFKLIDLASAALPTVTPGTAVSGTLTPGSSTNAYSFTATAGSAFFFDAQANAGSVSWQLFDSAGRSIFSNGFSDVGATTLTLGGRYTLLLQGYLGNTAPATYSFNVQPVAATTAALTLGALTSGTIATAGATNSYTFTVASTTRVVLVPDTNTLDTSAYGGSLGWTLAGPLGAVASRAFNNSLGVNFGSGTPALDLAAGTYTLTFGSSTASTGAFSFRLLDTAAATPITLGSPVSGTLSPGSDAKAYSFSATAGDKIFFDQTGSNTGYTYWRLLDPGNNVVFSNYLSNDAGQITMPLTGKYTLLIEGYPGAAAQSVPYSFTAYANATSNSIPIGTIGSTSSPDLVVQGLGVAASGGAVQSGATLTVSWHDANTGTKPTDASWTDQVVIRRVDTGEVLATTTLPYDAVANGALAGGGTLARSVTLALPAGNRGAGALSVVVTTDTGNTVSEENASGTGLTNNTASLAITSALAAYPDLTVSGITLTPAGGFAPGSTVTVQWMTTNGGNAALTTAFNETVSIRNTLTNQVIATVTMPVTVSAGSPLAAGGTLARSTTITWPTTVAGTGHFEVDVTTDAANTVFEANSSGTGETNNAASLQATSAPDLAISALAITSGTTVHSGDTVSLGWTDTNSGNASTVAGWVDRVRVVNTTTNTVVIDQAVDAGGVLAAGASRGRTYSFKLPDGAAGVGTLSITVTLDQDTNGASSLLEYRDSGNARDNDAATISATSTLLQYPDLVPTLTAPASATGAAPISVSWTVKNNGAGATKAGSWTDKLILSTTTTIGAASDVVLGTFTHTGDLAAGGQYTQTQSVTLPASLSGTYYLTVVTDSGLAVLEPDTRANTVSAAKAITVTSAYAALTVSGITAPSATSSGGTVTVGWTVTNSGTGTTSAAQWRDEVILSTGTTPQASDIVLGTLTHNGALAALGSYAATLAVTLPANATGAYHLLVRTDVDGAVYENGHTAGNVAASATVTVSSPDLKTTVTAPSAVQPGQTKTITWTVTNNGLGVARGPWTDRIYVSPDGLLADATVLADVTRTGDVAAGGSYTGTASVQIPASLADGNATFIVVADVGGQVFQANGGADSTGRSTAATVTHADLTPTVVSAPAAATAGSTVTVNWTIKNQGTAATSGGWTDNVYLASGTDLTGATYLGQLAQAGPLAAGASVNATLSVTLPASLAPGGYHLVVRTDANSVVLQGTHTDNDIGASGVLTINQQALADLTPSGVTVTPSTGVQSGAMLTVAWAVQNSGAASVSGSFYTRVTAVNTTTGVTVSDQLIAYDASASGAIAAGASASQHATVTLPNGDAGVGTIAITVTVDSYNQVYEGAPGSAGETNNAKTITVASTLQPYPDLTVDSLAVNPTTPRSGQPITVTWKTANHGTGAVTTAFADRVQVINQTTGNTVLDQSLTYDPAASGNTAIAAGGSVARSVTLTLPDGAAGVGSLVVRVTTDSGSQVFERNTGGTGETNNVASLNVTSQIGTYPDLVVSNVTGPASAQAGQTVTVSWTETNTGTAPATGTWIDVIALAGATAATDRALLSQTESTQTIAAGASALRTATVVLPPDIDGSVKFAVTADATNTIIELNSGNNRTVAATATTIVPALSVSLSAASVGENAGPSGLTGTITRSGSTASALTVSLATNAGTLTIPATVIIPAGQAGASFTIGVVDDGLVTGARTATITSHSAGYADGSATVSVTNTDTPTLTLTAPATASESDPSVQATLTRNTPTDAPLTVTLISDADYKISPPSTLTFAAGQSTISFPLPILNDGLVEGPRGVNVSAQALGFTTGSVQVTVNDTNVPNLTLTLGQTSVSEAAGPNATTLTITRDTVSTQAIEVTLKTDVSQIRVPARVTIDAGSSSVTIPVSVVNLNQPIGGSRVVALQVSVSDSILRIPIPGTAVQTLLQVNGSVGPQLGISLAKTTISGTTTTTGTVTRTQADVSTALTVVLSSNDTTEAKVPGTVTIAAGATSATFTVTGVNDGAADSKKNVTITANATNFIEGSAAVTVTNRNLPDLTVTTLAVPATIVAGQTMSITYTVTNTGLATATAPFNDRVYLSDDVLLSSDDALAGTTAGETLVAGASYTRTVTFTAPTTPGNTYVLVQTDVDNAVTELDFSNNLRVSTTPVVVNPSYRATVAASTHAAPAGSTITFTGSAYDSITGALDPFKAVSIQVSSGGTIRTLLALTDATGKYTSTFHPLSSEMGDYTVTSAQPGVSDRLVQDNFSLLGMTALASAVTVTGTPNTTYTGQFVLQNASSVALTGLTGSVSGLPATATLTVQPIPDLAGNGSVTVKYSFVSSQPIVGGSNLVITSAEGTRFSLPFNVDVEPLRPQLVANPGSLDQGMVRGTSTLVSFDITNTGGAESGPLTVAIPTLPWLSLASSATIDSIASGGKATVTLRLAPGADLPLEEYAGAIVISGANVGVTEHFTFRAVSTAVGDVSVSVEDEYTYFAADKPLVAGALVTLSDPYTYAIVATGTTDASGMVHFTGVHEGTYALSISADKHDTFNGPITVLPGTDNSVSEFLHRQLVSYTWTVVPTTIQDHYQIVLQSTFETAVPAPVVTVDQPLLIPLVLPGQTTQMQMTLTNHGLIDANNLTVNVPDDPDFEITALVDKIAVLPAMSSITIPLTIRAKTTGSGIATAMANAGNLTQQGISVSGLGDSTAVETEGKYSTLAKCLGITTTYDYICKDAVWQSVPVSLDPVFCAEDVGGAGSSLASLLADPTKANLGSAGCSVLGALLTCLGASDCTEAIINSACGGIVGGLTGGPLGAAAGVAGAWSDILACLCSLGGLGLGGGGAVVSGGDGGGGFGGGGYGYSPGNPYAAPVGWEIPNVNCDGTPAASSVNTTGTELSEANQNWIGSSTASSVSVSTDNSSDQAVVTESNAVCATVRLQITQQAVITRTAFEGTLSIDNGLSTSSLTDVSITLDIHDSNGNSANDKFVIRDPTIGGFTGKLGSLTLSAQTDGTLRYIFVPTTDAAIDDVTSYEIGGTLHYVENGTAVDVPLSPAKIDVYPEARLKLDYFWQRDVIGDDPFTDAVEPSEPFYLGLRVVNDGKGAADDLTISSAQPQIIENEKGLLINFQITGSQVGAQESTPSLTVDLGTVAPGATITADWSLLSTLQGKFKDFSATFTHEDDKGDLRTSLIDSVNIHELTRLVHVTTPTDDGIADFLVNDIPDANNNPDTLYLSTGGQAPVSMAANVSIANAGALTETLTATQQSGWSYITVADPAPGLKLLKVTRSDGKDIPIDGMVWRTDRSFPANAPEPIDENLLHLLDFDGTGSYTLTFVSDDHTPPHIDSITDLSGAVRTAAVNEVDVQLSKPVDDTTFTTAALNLTRNGVAVTLSGLTITDAGSGLYKITGLAALTAADGNYVFSVDGTKLSDPAGNVGDNAISTSFTVSTTGAAILTGITPVTPAIRNTSVDSVDVTVSAAITPASFTTSALHLTRNGVAVTLDSRVTVVALSATSFRIGGLATLTAAEGNYVLSVTGSQITDTLGHAATGVLSDSWVVDKTAPVVAAIEQITTNPRNTIVQSLDVTLSEAIDPTSFDWHAVTITKDGGPNLSSAAVTVTQIDATHYRLTHFNDSFNAATGIDGTYTITVNGATLRDLAGNAGTGTVTESWVLQTAGPAAPTSLVLSPDTGSSSTDGLTNTTHLTLSGSVGTTNLAVRFTDMTNGTELGYATVTGTNFAGSFTLAGPGAHHLRARVIDGAGNTADSFIDVFVDLAQPTVTALSSVSPDPRTTPVDSIDVTLSKAIVAASFDASAVVLTRDGVIVAPTGVTITALGGNVWRIGGLTTLTGTPGAYDISINASHLRDAAGNTGVSTLHDTWTNSISIRTGFGGVIYNDDNGDGTRSFGPSVPVYDAQELGLSGWTVFLDTNKNGKLDAGERSVVTGADGSYSFADLAAGTYTVSVVGKTGFVTTAPANATASVTVVADTYVSTSVDFGEFQLASVSGTVFNDADGDGSLDSGETATAGWTVFLDLHGDGILHTDDPSVVTGADGAYSFSNIGPGTIRIGEVAQTGFGRSSPETPITVTSGYNGQHLDIGNVALATISGNVYSDANGDGARATADAGLPQWTVFLDANNDGLLESSETSTLSDTAGNFTFTGLLPGHYTVRIIQQAGYLQTAPSAPGAASSDTSSNSTQSLTTTSADTPIEIDCTCGGTWAVQGGIDLGAQSVVDAADLTELTQARADAAFANLLGQGETTVVIDTGIDNSHPFFGAETVTPGRADRIVYEYDFADNRADASDRNGHGSNVASLIASSDTSYPGVAPDANLIVLKVFDDSGNGTFGYVEQALQWVVAHADMYHIGVVNMSLGDGGNWTDSASRYGLGDEFQALEAENVIVVAAAGNNYSQFNSLGVAYPASDPAVIAVGSVWSGDFGGPWRVSTGAVDYTTGADHIAAYSQRDPNLLDTMAPGSRFNGANATGGVTTMQGTSQAAAYVSGAATLVQQLAMQVLGRHLSTAEFASLLRSTGDMIVDGAQNNDNVRNTGLSFPRLDFEKLFKAIEAYNGVPSTLPSVTNTGTDGTTVTTSAAAASGYYSITVTSGQTSGGHDFGEFKYASIAGTVFNDTDKNGQKGAIETAVSGATVFLDANGNGKDDLGEVSAITSATGAFSFANIGPGSYKVVLVVPTGSVATTPDPVTVVATSGLAANVLFGETTATAPGNPVVTATGTPTALLLKPYVLTLGATDPGHTIAAWVINWGDGTVQTLTGNPSQATHIYQKGGATYTVDAAIRDDIGLHHAAALHVTVPIAQTVTSVKQTLSGVSVRFSDAFDPSVINVYGDDANAANEDDVRLVGSIVGVVRGSLVFDADLKGFTFIKSGAPLAADTYTLLLRSGGANFHDAAGGLDGDGDGKPGGYYTTTFVVPPFNGALLSMPDVIRAPGQSVTATAGGTSLPIMLHNALHITRVAFHIDYNPALLTITGAVSDIASVTIKVDLSVPGRASFVVTSPTQLGVADVTLMRLLATVPATAPYGSTQILTPIIDGFYGAVVYADSALQVVAYLGDANGDGSYDAGDVTAVQNYVAKVGTGFSAWRNIAPSLIADVNRDGSVNAADLALLSQQAAGATLPEFLSAEDLYDDSTLSTTTRAKLNLTKKVTDFAIAASTTSIYSTSAGSAKTLKVTL